MEEVLKSIDNVVYAQKRDMLISAMGTICPKIEFSITILKEVLEPFLQDEEIALLIAKYAANESEFNLIPNEFSKNREFMFKAIESNFRIIEFVCGANDNEEYIRHMAKCGKSSWFIMASPRIKNNREFILDVLKTVNVGCVYNIYTKYNDDEEILLEMITYYKQSPYYELDISDRLCANPEFMTKMLVKNPCCITKVNCDLPSEILYTALQLYAKYGTLKRALISCKPCVILPLIKHDGMLLEHIIEPYRTPEIVGLAVLQNKEAIKFV